MESVSERLLKASGVSAEDSSVVAKSLIESNLAGHDSHGLQMLPHYLRRIQKGIIKPGAPISVEKETSISALVNGNWNFGQLVAEVVTKTAVTKAETSGLSMVGSYNCNHVGRLGHYCEPIAEKGMIAIMMVNAPPSVAPWGGIERRLGTNPICIAAPRKEARPILLDMSTAVVANGKVSQLVGTGERIPEGWAIDSKGKNTTKPEDFEAGGAMLPLGKYKGYGLGLAIDLLCAAFTGSDGAGMQIEGENGVLMICMKSDLFVPSESFSSTVENTIRFVQSSQLQKGFNEILLPGQPEASSIKERSQNGIFVYDVLWKKLEKWANQLSVDLGQ